jgi:cytochrome P450
LQPLFFRFTLNTTMFLLFGRSIDSLKMQSNADSADTGFANDFNLAQDYLARRGRLGGLYWLIGGSEFKHACKSVHIFLDGIIHKALEADRVSHFGEKNKANYVLLDELIEETKDPVILRSQLLNVLLAGRDTTACCLSWALCVSTSQIRRCHPRFNYTQPPLITQPRCTAETAHGDSLNCR